MNKIQLAAILASALLTLAPVPARAQTTPAPTEVRPTVSVNGVKPQARLTPDETTSMSVENQKWSPEAERPFIIRATGKEVTGSEWKEYSFSFTSDKDGYLWLSLEGQYPEATETNKDLFKVDYDLVSVTGGTIENGDFEVRTQDGKPKFWSYSKDVIPNGSKPALSGENFVTATSGNRVGIALKGTAGQLVTVTFNARAHAD